MKILIAIQILIGTFLTSQLHATTLVTLSAFSNRTERVLDNSSVVQNNRDYLVLLGFHQKLASGLTIGVKGLHRQRLDITSDTLQISSLGLSIGFHRNNWFGNITNLKLYLPQRTVNANTTTIHTGDDGYLWELGYLFPFFGASLGPSLYYSELHYSKEAIDGTENASFTPFLEKNLHPLLNVIFHL